MLKHIAISASAGSGKTYQLTNRFIYLLHLAEQPERIIALTFTRTAAGEFFHKIIEKLCQAAGNESKAKQLSSELSIEADSARYHYLLKLLISQMHRLNLQTLDSFFFRVVSAFSLELGLSGNLNLLDETAEPRLRNEVRDSIVHHAGKLDDALHEFWHAFKQATYGHEARSVETVVSGFIEQLYSLYLEAPQAELWGNPKTIWPNGCHWLSAEQPNWDELADALIASLPEDLSKSQISDFDKAAMRIRHYPLEEKTNTLLDRAFAQSDEVFAGHTVLQCGRGKNNQAQLSGLSCEALGKALRAIVWHHMNRALQNTRGVHRILQAYHSNYDRLVRRAGRLSFSDLTHLLSPESAGSPMQLADEATRELMDYRLDGQYDHWLFDEFQDTSRPQWDVVQNLISEIIQDSSEERSLFYVGDTKQCLYLWRNSDDRLFHDILRHYPNIEKESLTTSWRSAPAILDAVNTVFEDSALISECFSEDAALRWARAWSKHKPSPATQGLSGYACWLEAKKADPPTRNEHILKILHDLQPIEHSISVGILVRKNADANEIADYLRKHSQFPVHTGSAVRPAVDNAAGMALLSMLRLAAHPGDTHAKGFLNLVDQSTGGESLEAAIPELRVRLSTDSSEAAIGWACSLIETHLPEEDSRHRDRLEALIHLARSYDSEELSDIDSLCKYLEESSSGETSPKDAIIVETIHKSKGLEYDVVILVNEDKSSRSETRINPLLDAQGKTQWIIEPIKKDLMLADDELCKLHAQNESQKGFGSLCTLYVAMTRAKRALYMISDFDRVSEHSTVNYLRQRLGDTADNDAIIWQTGDPNWDKSLERASKEVKRRELPLESPTFEPAHPRLTLSRPSTAKTLSLKPDRHFDLKADAAEFGTAVHAAFEQIEWWDQPLATEDIFGAEDPAITAAIERCFENTEIRDLFTKGDAKTLLWREQSFSYVEDNTFVNGTFDRVHIAQDKNGTIIGAMIIDFKTDRIHSDNTIEKATEFHRPQLSAYTVALSKILGIDTELIEGVLIFTHCGQLVKL